jgi:serine/threonine protein kinase
VSDLGLSGFMHEADEDPRAGKIVGTADYLSPEQIHSPLEVTSVSDIYSLGCTLYYAISGKVPFLGGTTKDKARRHLEETPWHPRRFNSEVSEEFVEVIADMMEKEPKKRVQTAGEVVARLEPWARDSSPLPSQQLTKSPWMPPPLPIGDDRIGRDERQQRCVRRAGQPCRQCQPGFPIDRAADLRQSGNQSHPPSDTAATDPPSAPSLSGFPCRCHRTGDRDSDLVALRGFGHPGVAEPVAWRLDCTSISDSVSDVRGYLLLSWVFFAGVLLPSQVASTARPILLFVADEPNNRLAQHQC